MKRFLFILWLVIPTSANACPDFHRARILQSELMVSALVCNNKKQYNEYVTTFRNQLTIYGHQFNEAYGNQTNAVVTRLANEASIESQDRNFCKQTTNVFNILLQSNGLAEIIKNRGCE